MKNELLEQISVPSRWCVWSTGIGYHKFFREGYPGLIGLPETYLRKEFDPRLLILKAPCFSLQAWVEKAFSGNYQIPHKDLEKNSEL